MNTELKTETDEPPILDQPKYVTVLVNQKNGLTETYTKEEAIENLRVLSQKKRRKELISKYLHGLILTVVGLYLAISCFGYLRTGSWKGFNVNVLGVFYFLNIAYSRSGNLEQKETAKALAQIEDKNSVGILLEALNYNPQNAVEYHLDHQVSKALTNILPTIKFDERALIEPNQLELLYYYLRKRDDDLTVSIVKCLGNIGDEDAKHALEKLLAPKLGKKRPETIIGVIEQALAKIEHRLEKSREAAQLLRASSASNEPSEVLLRPAKGSDNTPSDLLLRSSSDDKPLS